MKPHAAFLALLAGLMGFACAAAAAEPSSVTVNIVHENATGVLRINGVPVHRFGTGATASGKVTDTIGAGLWLVEGENVIDVESRAKSGGSTQVIIVRTIGDPTLFERTIDGAGAAQYKLTLAGVPRWGWLDAEVWEGDDTALLAAVAALRAACAKPDVKALLAAFKPFDDDVRPYIGPQLAGAEKELSQTLKGAKVAALPGDLSVARFYGNRLFVVQTADGAPPIAVSNEKIVKGRPVLEPGQYWIRKNGKWSIIRP